MKVKTYVGFVSGWMLAGMAFELGRSVASGIPVAVKVFGVVYRNNKRKPTAVK